MESIATIILAYLLGSIPTAYLVARYVRGIDIRRTGNQNVGAINAYRQVGKAAGVLVLVVDAGKGALAVFIGQRLGAPDIVIFAAAFAATLGHNFTPFLKFRGGKGAATVLGISAVLLWPITAVTLGAGVVLFAITRHAVWSLTGMFVLLNALTIALQPIGPVILCLTLSFVIAGTHFFRQHPQLIPAIRQGDWRRFMSID